jgi:hypothetical protein
MAETALTQQIEALFRETSGAHHYAYRETDGADPEWPLWYAEYLQPKLNTLLNTTFTKSELVSLLVLAANEQARIAPGTDWPSHYAQFLVRHAGATSERDAPMNVPTGPVPDLTTEQMIEVDRAMIEDFHIELIQMMENAWRTWRGHAFWTAIPVASAWSCWRARAATAAARWCARGACTPGARRSRWW